jgi:serine/threonine protein kinase
MRSHRNWRERFPAARFDGMSRQVDLELFLRLAIQIAAAVARMHHRGVLHKDINPPTY